MSWSLLFFILIGAVSVAAAVGVVSSRQPIHSALYLLMHFVTLAVLYITLDAQFLAAIQVIIYAGGIVILILFVIMLIGSNPVPGDPSIQTWGPFVGLGLGLVLLGSMVYTVMLAFDGVPAAPVGLVGGEPKAVGLTLFSQYVLPIQMVAVLLLVALIGALLVARRPKTDVKTTRSREAAAD
ncbi:MAG: NADH-quinone oxidoreductase subunit J [Caldilineaceae bacterium]|nr:NADH-quinone oxidoreductase subunit J [Caldilineaceae bacterium]MCB9162631.1 NADH-quinone oxidoreductase subunit J [Caldilineaceae bacterium]